MALMAANRMAKIDVPDVHDVAISGPDRLCATGRPSLLSLSVLLRVFTPEQRQKNNENYFHIAYGQIRFIRMVQRF